MMMMMMMNKNGVPILFKGGMIQATLEGRKTQTRRPVTPSPDNGPDDWDNATELECGLYWPTVIDSEGMMQPANEQVFGAFNCEGDAWKCPYGQVGDRLWVRETWASDCTCENPKCNGVIYKAGYSGVLMPEKWRPSIFMPRWASRITLEITGIRVERVQDITLEACWDEGICTIPAYNRIDDYHKLWDSINAKRGYSWADNPWVWIIEFRRIAQEGE